MDKEYKKDFEKWHKLKSQIDRKKKIPYFKQREIWFCSVGANVGCEQDGWHEYFERPVLILKKFNDWSFLALPLTTKIKNRNYHFSFWINGKINDVIISQARFLDARRLNRKMSVISIKDFALVKVLFKRLVD